MSMECQSKKGRLSELMWITTLVTRRVSEALTAIPRLTVCCFGEVVIE